jgi:hypothetical protein
MLFNNNNEIGTIIPSIPYFGAAFFAVVSWGEEMD